MRFIVAPARLAGRDEGGLLECRAIMILCAVKDGNNHR